MRRQKSVRVVRGRAEGSSERGAEAGGAVRHWRRDVRPRALAGRRRCCGVDDMVARFNKSF